MSPRRKELVTQHTPDCLTLVLISDTHDMHREVEVPNGDLLIHAGDFTMNSMSAEKLIDFNEWLGELPHAFRVVIPGNHDFIVEDSTRHQLITNASLLIHEGIEVMGLKIWGSQQLRSLAKLLELSLTGIERSSIRVSPAIQMF